VLVLAAILTTLDTGSESGMTKSEFFSNLLKDGSLRTEIKVSGILKFVISSKDPLINI